MMEAFLVMLVLLVSDLVGARLSIGQYDWFINLEHYLKGKFIKMESLLDRIFKFKLFHCEKCIFFWTSLLLFCMMYSFGQALVFSILFYLAKATD